ncbi:hypothetical protein L486_01566 [Kwoniella mangroviensis CBS 10435]|uniref:SCP domain-containing protein n=1 Tax=Kwoniella mangroviensis CBS 10435 TaxID=1331196 RepID=A0A1B9J285_9TREE|nr:hypothetical protein L486_01566 [Kwoniella mangroviensis CBS 10435]
MRLALSTTLLIFSLLLITTTAHPSGHPRRRHANRQRRSRVQLSTSTINTPTTAITTPQNGITNDNTTEPTALGLWTPSSASVAGTSNANAAAAAPQASASASALGLFTPPSEDEGTPDSEAGSEGYGGWGGGGGGGGGKKGGWGGGSWRGGGWGGVQSQQQSQPSSAPVASDMGVDISAGVDVSILKAGGGAGYGGYDAQSTAPASQPYAYQPPESQPYSEAPVPSISSPSYVAPPATTSYERPPIYSSNYIEVTEWYTPSTPGTSSYQAPALSGQTDEGAIPTSQMYSPPPVAGIPTPILPNSPSAANTGYSSSTAGGYSSNAVVTSGGRVVHTSSWKSSWTNSWSNAPSTTSQAPVATSAPQDDDQRKFVDCHNQWRNQYGAGNVSWGDELASYANTHASVCASMTHTNGPYGENLAAGTDGFMDIISSIGMWMDEASDYDASNPTYSHFTQVVWKETTTIGCAAINCGANTGMAGQIYIMCEYHPRGNVIGAFAQNVGKK